MRAGVSIPRATSLFISLCWVGDAISSRFFLPILMQRGGPRGSTGACPRPRRFPLCARVDVCVCVSRRGRGKGEREEAKNGGGEGEGTGQVVGKENKEHGHLTDHVGHAHRCIHTHTYIDTDVDTQPETRSEFHSVGARHESYEAPEGGKEGRYEREATGEEGATLAPRTALSRAWNGVGRGGVARACTAAPLTHKRVGSGIR